MARSHHLAVWIIEFCAWSNPNIFQSIESRRTHQRVTIIYIYMMSFTDFELNSLIQTPHPLCAPPAVFMDQNEQSHHHRERAHALQSSTLIRSSDIEGTTRLLIPQIHSRTPKCLCVWYYKLVYTYIHHKFNAREWCEIAKCLWYNNRRYPTSAPPHEMFLLLLNIARLMCKSARVLRVVFKSFFARALTMVLYIIPPIPVRTIIYI